MAEIRLVDRFGSLIGPTTVGAVVALLGTGFLFLYPLTVAGLVPGTEQFGSTRPQPIHPVIVYLSAIIGGVSMTWGIFASLDDDYRPLTPRRAFAVLGPAVVSLCSGVSWFVFRWAGKTLESWCATQQRTYTITLIQALKFQLDAVQFIALAAVSATFVGTVAAMRDRRTALAATALPIAFAVPGVFWGPQSGILPGVIAIVAFSVIPFAVGYTAARAT
ncbi:MAG: hypothetical protein ABEJ86_05580 [Halococcoides sp.]